MSWEKSIIGTALNDPSSFELAVSTLVPSDFDQYNQIIFAEMLNLHTANALDIRALIERLNNCLDTHRLVSGIGNIEDYIQECLTFRGTAMSEYVNQVLNSSIKRTLQRNIALIAAEAEDNRRNTEELLDLAESKILSLRRSRTDDGISMSDLYGLFIPRLEGLRSGLIRPAWIPHVDAVREVIDFAEGSDFIVVAARPGQGKSSYLRYEAYSMGIHGHPIVIFNLENDKMEYAKHFVSLHTGIDNSMLKDPRRLSPQQLEQIKEAARELSRMPIILINAAGWTVDQIVRKSRQLISDNKASVIQLDYIQLINNGSDKRVEDVGYTTNKLRSLALSTGTPIIAASQLSRNIEHRATNAEPMLSDLRESGSIEQDATIVMFLRSPWVSPTNQQKAVFPENVDANGRVLERLKAIPLRFHTEKNRNGEIGPSWYVKWSKGIGNFQTLERNFSP